MKIFVLGCTGMLGAYVFKYLNSCYSNVIGLCRKELDATNVPDKYLYTSGFSRDDVVINCIGLIKQRLQLSKLDFLLVNSIFPLKLSKICNEIGCNLIHVTTDCVFNGNAGDYNESSLHDSDDIYGISKSLGEPGDCTVIRTSIIGEEHSNFLSLLEWVKSQRNKEVKGFVNHFWNGVTCLQWAKICEQIIDKKLFWNGVRHIYSPTSISKYDLIRVISEIYNLNIKVLPFETEKKCDRTLTSIRKDIIFDIPDIKVQIQELKNFSL